MKIVDNRYKSEEIVERNAYKKTYKVKDLLGDECINLIKFYDEDSYKGFIDYLIEEFIFLKTINHENILRDRSFNLAKTLDMKKTNYPLYYIVTEYIDGQQLHEVYTKLNWREKAKILLDIIMAIDYLHFRGLNYGGLNPTDIFIDKDNNIKLLSMVSILEKRYNMYFDSFTKDFILPELFINREYDNRNSDYYSLAMLTKFLFIKNYKEKDPKQFIYRDDEFKLKDKNFLNKLINKLSDLERIDDEIDLKDIVNDINQSYQLGYNYDLANTRNHLHFANKIIGRDEEIEAILDIDKKILQGNNKSKGVIISAESGVGKTRFLEEIGHRLRMRDRDIYSIEIVEDETNDLIDMANILKQSIKDTPIDLMEKYKNELSRILPELRISSRKKEDSHLSENKDRYRIYNRITNYFRELSRIRPIYIIIDNIQNANSNLISLLDYLILNTKSKNIFFIISYNEENLCKDRLVYKIVSTWIENSYLEEFRLLGYSYEEVGEFIRNILGMAHVPKKLSTLFFRESQGNLRYIEYLIKNLFSEGELYMKNNGRWYFKFDNLSDIHFPTDMDEVLEKQVLLIKGKYIEVFKLLSAFESHVYHKHLMKLIEGKEQIQKEKITDLIGLGIISEKLGDLGYSYSIKNYELKKMIYSEINQLEKIKIHSNIARILLDMETENLDLVLDELVFQLIKSKKEEKAIDIILTKVENIDNRFSAQTRYLLEKAYSITNEKIPDKKLLILEKLVDSLWDYKGYDEGENYLIEYIELARKEKAYKHFIKGKSKLIDLYYKKAQKEEELETIKEIEEMSNKYDYKEGKIIVLISKARINIDENYLKEAEKQLNKAIDISKEENIKSYLGIIYNRLGIINYYVGQTPEAIEAYKKSIAYFEEINDPVGTAGPLNNIGNIYSDYYDDFEKSYDYYNKGLAITNRYEIEEMSIFFLVNIGAMYMEDYKFETAIDYLERVIRSSKNIENVNIGLLANINLARIYIDVGEIDQAYRLHLYLKKTFQEKDIKSMELLAPYNSFLAYFYGYLGMHDKGLEYSALAYDYYKDFNIKSAMEAKLNKIFMNYYASGKYDKKEIEDLISTLKEKKLGKNIRKALITFSTISVLENDIEFTRRLLDEDDLLEKDIYFEELTIIKKIISYSMIPDKKQAISRIESIISRFSPKVAWLERTFLHQIISDKYYQIGRYKRALKHLLEMIDIISKFTFSIPDPTIRYMYIKSRKVDQIKEKIQNIIKLHYGKDLECKRIRDIGLFDLYDYFDISPIVEAIGMKEFIDVTKLDYFSKVEDIRSIDDLINRLNHDPNNNLDILLKYLGKETFAKMGCIFKYDRAKEEYRKIALLDENDNSLINDNLIKLSNRENGVLININNKKDRGPNYCEFLLDDLKAIILLPIDRFVGREVNHRKKKTFGEKKVQTYIYLETDSIFNRFDEERYELVERMSYLLLMNLENIELKRLATTDKLTGLFTRRFYEERLKELIENTQFDTGKFTVLMLDIDKFKSINDSYGHRKGDTVLEEMASILRSSIRSTDIAGRHGGEEFIIILKDIDKIQGEIKAEKIRKKVENHVFTGIEHKITISIGISEFPIDSQLKDELIEKADQALYNSKQRGRNRVSVWDSKMGRILNRTDKLAGLVTGNMDQDNRNLLSLMDILELSKENKGLEYKTYYFLGEILESLEASHGSLILVEENQISSSYTRERFIEAWVENRNYNIDIIEEVLESKKGNYQIDWENIESIDSISGLPNWQSIIVLPVIKNDIVKAILYLSVALRNKEFDFRDFNLASYYVNAYGTNL